MSRGIIINGASGTGKTTLAAALANHLSFKHFDLDDYYHRKDTKIPFTEYYPREEIRARLMHDISQNPDFVMSGSIGSILWDLVNPLFDLAVLLFVPVEIRLARVHAREAEWFGARILEGGDMYENHKDFINTIQSYENAEPPAVCLKRHELWAAELLCPVLRLDGTKPVCENVTQIAEQFWQSGQSAKDNGNKG